MEIDAVNEQRAVLRQKLASNGGHFIPR